MGRGIDVSLQASIEKSDEEKSIAVKQGAQTGYSLDYYIGIMKSNKYIPRFGYFKYY